MYFDTAQHRRKTKDRGRQQSASVKMANIQLGRNVHPGSLAKLLQSPQPRAVMGSREPAPGWQPGCVRVAGLKFGWVNRAGETRGDVRSCRPQQRAVWKHREGQLDLTPWLKMNCVRNGQTALAVAGDILGSGALQGQWRSGNPINWGCLGLQYWKYQVWVCFVAKLGPKAKK